MTTSGLAAQYLKIALAEIDGILSSQLTQIQQAGELLAETWSSGGCLFLSYTNHVLSTELVDRAGGPARALALDHGGTPGNQYSTGLVDVQAGDLILMHSNCGIGKREASIVDLARQIGATTVALTQVRYELSPLVSGSNPTGQSLHQMADLTVDIGGVVGDAALNVPGFDVPVCPTSGVTGVATAWAIIAHACETLADRQLSVPFFLSGQLDRERLGAVKRTDRDTWLTERRSKLTQQ